MNWVNITTCDFGEPHPFPERASPTILSASGQRRQEGWSGKVLILHLQYSPEFMLYTAMCLLYKYHKSSHPLSYDMEILCHISTCDMISSSHTFLNEFIHDLLEHFSSLFNQFSHDLIMFSRFSIFQFTYCHLYIYIIGGSTYGSAVCMHRAHSSPLSLSIPSCSWSASHNTETTFAGLSLCCIQSTPNLKNVWVHACAHIQQL